MLKNRQSSTTTVEVYLGQFRETAKLIDLTFHAITAQNCETVCTDSFLKIF